MWYLVCGGKDCCCYALVKHFVLYLPSPQLKDQSPSKYSFIIKVSL